MLKTALETKVMTVNPAFLREVKEDGIELWMSVHQLRAVCDEENPTARSVVELAHLLERLREQMAQQFLLEETYGYVEVPAVMAPAIAELAQQTHAEHCCLFLTLSDLVEHAQELQYRGVELDELDRLMESTRSFERAIRHHEENEQELIVKSFSVC